jgi:hypothetical protein
MRCTSRKPVVVATLCFTIATMACVDDIVVKFPDDAEPRRLYPPKDYTDTLEVRVRGATLLVAPEDMPVRAADSELNPQR